MTPDPNRNFYPFQRIITNFRSNPKRSHRDLVQILRDPARSRRYPTKSQSDLLFLSDLDGANKISTPVIKPEANSNQPKTDKTRTKKSNQIRQVNFGSKFPSTRIIRVEFRLGTNPTRPNPWTTLLVTIKSTSSSPFLSFLSFLFLFFCFFVFFF